MLRVKLQNGTDQPWMCDEDLKNLSITGDGKLLLDVIEGTGITQFSSKVEVSHVAGYKLNGGTYRIAEVWIDTPEGTFELGTIREHARKLSTLKQFNDDELLLELERRGHTFE